MHEICPNISNILSIFYIYIIFIAFIYMYIYKHILNKKINNNGGVTKWPITPQTMIYNNIAITHDKHIYKIHLTPQRPIFPQ